jgi:hypothetical protein
MKTKYKSIFVLLLVTTIVSGLTSCKKYLDEVPDKSLVVPTTLADCQALLNDYTIMNGVYPEDGEAASDNFYISNAIFNALPNPSIRLNNVQDNFIWKAQAQHDVLTWHYPYKTVYNSNLILRTLENKTTSDALKYNTIKGSALFFRSFAFYNIAQLFCKPYNASTAGNDLGIVLRLDPDLDKKSVRSTVQQTYDQITNDLKQAANLLPVNNGIKSNPNKIAAFSMLARTYLAMEKYSEAGIYADSCLALYNTLIDYKTVNSGDPTSPYPVFQPLNPEVIFQAACNQGQIILNPTYGFIQPDLYNSYNSNDLRKSLFFSTDPDSETNSFRGSYDGTEARFCGLATDEVFLIRAECYARAGNINAAMADLNTLMKNRWTNSFTNFTALNASDALKQILKERRKELVFRTLRWTDLRRLNKDTEFAITLSRTYNETIYTLPPNDARYTMLIPLEVINTSGIQQNIR